MRGLRVLLIAVCLPACHGGSSKEAPPPPEGALPVEPAVAEVSWTRDVWPVILIRCQVCHTTGVGAEQVPDMLMNDAITLYQRWVRVSSQCNPNLFRVYPSRNDLSFVVDKISTNAPLCGQRMPLLGPPLDPAEQQVFQDWIDQGALLN